GSVRLSRTQPERTWPYVRRGRPDSASNGAQHVIRRIRQSAGNEKEDTDGVQKDIRRVRRDCHSDRAYSGTTDQWRRNCYTSVRTIHAILSPYGVTGDFDTLRLHT